jgi:hypothetical protein
MLEELKRAIPWHFSTNIHRSRGLLTATLILAISLTLGVLPSTPGHADQVMPNFADVPNGWYVDRFAPNSFTNVGTFVGRNDVLGIEITSAQGFNNRPSGYQSTFYNTQGLGHDITNGGPGSALSADLYIPSSWGSASNGNVRTDMWGVMTNGTDVTGYPIIGFTNYGGAPRFRVWDEVDGGWNNLATPVKYDTWTDFSIQLTGSAFLYYINGSLVATDTGINGSTAFKEVIMQAYNFFGDPSIPDANPINYTAHWSNTQAPVPVPASMLLLGSGLFGLALLRGRKLLHK